MRTRGRRALTIAFEILAFSLWSAAATAQHMGGRITGIVRDDTALAVSAVRVDSVETSSGRVWSATTDALGTYDFPVLPAGTCRVTARRTGFKTTSTAGFTLDAGQTVRLDLTLEIGSLADHVDVTAQTSLLQTAATGVSFVISSREASRLPANGQNFMWLTLLVPGVVSPNLAFWANGQRTTGGGRPYVNGNRKEANNFQLDGVDANQTTDNLVAYQPSLDAIQQVQILTNTAAAEVGNYQGAIVDVTLKSGTNQAHGSAFDFLRDDALNAAPWSANWQPIDPLNPRRKPSFRDHVLGGTVGGPIVANRIFFFGDYQAARVRNGRATSLINVVPLAMRRGDLSALLAGSNPQQIQDPLTTRPDPAHPGQFLRDPFPNNQVPVERINPVASALFSSRFYPEPTVQNPAGNVFNTTESMLDNDQFDIKLDAKPGVRDDVSARYAHGLQTTAASNSQAILLSSGTSSPFRAAVVDWTRQLRPSLLNHARIGFNRIVLLVDSGIDTDGIGMLGEAIGIAGANRRGPGLPGLVFAGAVTSIGSPKVVQQFAATTFQYQDSLSWHRGPHAVKAGTQAVLYRQDVYFSGNNGQMGVFEFNGQYTRDLNDPRSIGSPVADFLLGYPSRMVRGDFADTWRQRSTLWSAFVQDDWRASTNVTANLGLRYEYRSPLVEAQDRQVNFDLATGRALMAGRDGNSRALYEPYRWDFQPRVGVAWTPARWRQRLVVRGGYAISSFQEGTGTNLRLTLNPPFFNEFETVNRNPSVLGSTIATGFDALREKDPLVGTILRAWDLHLRPARSQQWNVAVERQVGHDVAFTVGYVGQYGTGLVMPVNADQPRHAGEPRPLDAVYPQIAGVVLTAANANQRYDALQASARKRFSSGWEFRSAYTLSHGMSHGRGFFSEGGQTAEPASFWPNPYDRDAEWGPVAFDVRHNAVAAGIWDLPFGRERRWLADAPMWIDRLAGGWSLAAIWKAHTGFPITIVAPDQSGTGARSGRPDQIAAAEGPHKVGAEQFWFNASAFLLPRAGTFGNAGVGRVRGPGLDVVDVSIGKQMDVVGRARIEMRADAFNVFNRPQFNAPDRSLTSSTFGRVLSAQLSREIQLGVRLSF